MNEGATAVLVGGPADGVRIGVEKLSGRIGLTTRQYEHSTILAVYSLVDNPLYAEPQEDGDYRYSFAGYDEIKHDKQ